jgi:hypothetical protein
MVEPGVAGATFGSSTASELGVEPLVEVTAGPATLVGSGAVAVSPLVASGIADDAVVPSVVDVHAASAKKAEIIRPFKRDLVRHIENLSRSYFERERSPRH